MRSRRPDLLAQFGVLTLLIAVGIGVIFVLNDRSTLRGEVERSAVEYSSATVNILFQAMLRKEDIAAGPSAITALELTSGLALSKRSGGYYGAAIWNLGRRATFSDIDGVPGTTLPDSSEADQAYAGTATHRHVDGTPLRGLPRGDYLELFVPIRFASDPTVYGVVSVYTSYANVEASLDRSLWRTVGIVGGALALAWLVLFRLVAGASRSLRRQSAENERLAREDMLTGLPNRYRFYEEAERALPEAVRAGEQAAGLVVDLDRFKEINDALGHATGDELLRRVAPRLRDAAGDGAVVARLGGDEFAVLLPRIRSVTEATGVAERILGTLDQPVAIDDLSLVVDGSAGIALHPRHGDLDAVMRAADIAMYAAKESGSGYAVYDDDIDASTPERLAKLADLRDGIERGELVVEYQPKADAATGRVTGVEALVRWHSPARGVLSPGRFVPLAERTALIKPLTAAVLDQALADCRSWLDQGIVLPVAVNLSARRLVDLDLPDEIVQALAARGVPPDLLELEITESAIMHDAGRSTMILERLSDLGISIAIDDFGTGYSSFAHLRRLPVATMKIDRSFVAEMDTVGADAAIVESALALGRNLGLKVVAEGVETRLTWGRLALLGCDEIQGWALSKALPADELVAWLREDPLRLGQSR